MKEIIPDIDKLFKDASALDDEAPSDKVWESIENRLDKKTVIQITKSYDRLKWVAAILLLLLSGITSYLFLRDDKDSINKEMMVNAQKSRAISNATKVLKDSLVTSKDVAGNRKNNNTANLGASPNHLQKNLLNNQSNQSGSNFSVNGSYKKYSTSGQILNSTALKNVQILSGLTKKLKSKNNLLMDVISPATYELSNRSNNFIKSQNIKKLLDNQPSVDSKIVSIFPYIPLEISYNVNLYKLSSNFQPLYLSNSSLNKLDKKIGKNKSSKISPFSITAFYSPDLSFSHLSDDKPHGPDNDRHHIKGNEKHSFSFTSGIIGSYDLNKHFSIQSGISFSQSIIDNDPKNLIAEKDDHGSIKYRFDASCGFGYILPKSGPPPNLGDTLRGVSSKNTLQYAQIPLSIKYSQQHRKLSLNAMTGLSVNTLVSGNINTSLVNPSTNTKESQTINSVQGLKKFSISGLLGAGIEFSFSKLISATFSPTARIALSSINSGSVVKSYPTTIGISTGIKLRL